MMNTENKILNIRTLGLYVVVALVATGLYTAGLLVMKKNTEQASSTVSKVQGREDGRRVLSSVQSARLLKEDAGDTANGSEVSNDQRYAQANSIEGVTISGAVATSAAAGADRTVTRDQIAAVNTSQLPTDSATMSRPAPIDPSPEKSTPEVQQAPASTDSPQSTSLIGGLIKGITGILLPHK